MVPRVKPSRNLLYISILLNFVASILLPQSGSASPVSQGNQPDLFVQSLMAEMTPQEKIGQLFLVSFSGTDIAAGTEIYDLIINQHVGGVVLNRENDNFTASLDTLANTRRLINDLQTLEWHTSQGTILDPNTNQVTSGTYLPLFIGVNQSGGGYPTDQILDGLTPLPNFMSLGATWQPSLAKAVGSVAGQELSALGFNLFLGPSLDVLVTSGTSGGGDLGANAFGGDPYWVGEMGREFISGVHEGSQGRMAVIANHFPGVGSSDRPSDLEVATVRKSLDSLKQIELAPFFAVTGETPGAVTTTDGLLVAHIRYQGFQGNIRATTKPVSFDSQALAQILALSPFVTWRQSGGIMVSEDLGSESVRLFYDPSNQSFSARIVSRDAFLAGNDLLYLGNIRSSEAEDTHTSVIQVLDFFTQKYTEDNAFAQRVDESVARILSLKFRLYGDFSLSRVLPDANLSDIGNSQAVSFDVARQSATLINPDALNLDSQLPSPPGTGDRILFLTDARSQQQCSTCSTGVAFNKSALSEAVLRLYGPLAGGLISLENLSNFGFDELRMILEGGGGNTELEAQLQTADWVIISLLDNTLTPSPVETLRTFFFERQDILRDKKVILLAFEAPYYLDATDISKLTAYYGLYSKSTPFIEVAARLVFKELTPVGALPVSVAGIGYDLLTATSPDPNQVINLLLDLPENPQPPSEEALLATATPFFKVGDTIPIKSGIILDHNGKPVPDGTGVQFTLTSNVEGSILQVVESTTSDGIARASFGINQPGLVEIRALIEPSVASVVLQLDITNEGFSITVVAPTPFPEETQVASTPTPMPTPQVTTPLDEGYPGFAGWFVTLLITIGSAWIAYAVGLRLFTAQWGLRWAVCILVSSISLYNLLAIGIQPTREWIQNNGMMAVLGCVVFGVVVGWLAGGAWLAWSMKRGSYKTNYE